MNASHFQERWEVYQFIVSYKHLYPIEKMYRVLKVSLVVIIDGSVMIHQIEL